MNFFVKYSFKICIFPQDEDAKMLIFPRLIQCAIDGFNVCIFAYGHTGSGKTFTMVGDRDRRNPGIIPRTFTKIFELIQDNESKFEFKVCLGTVRVS